MLLVVSRLRCRFPAAVFNVTLKLQTISSHSVSAAVTQSSAKMTALVAEFNSLGGHSIQENRQNYSRFVKKVIALESSDRSQVLNALKVNHRQEELYFTKLALKCDDKEKIKEILLSGDRILSRLITYYKPFIFRDCNVDFFFNELFPNVSYIVRNKCISNLAGLINRDDVGRDFFNATLKVYGIKYAVPFLTVCDESFIRAALKHYRIVFKERQLIKLHQRFGLDFTDFYYTELCKYDQNDEFTEQPCFARYLSTKDIKSFHHMLKYGTPKIGKRGIANFLKAYKEVVIKRPENYSFLKLRHVYRHLTRDEFKQYVINCLPAHAHLNNILKYLDYLPAGQRCNFVAEIYRSKYGCDIFETISNDDYYKTQLLQKLPLTDRFKFKLTEDERFIYEPPEKSFPIIKDRINLTSDINGRCELVMKLFRCAHNNKDESALLEALKYVLHRHKNDKASIRQDVFQFLKKEYKLETISDEIWTCVYELIVTEEVLNPSAYNMYEMWEEVLKRKYFNGIDCLSDLKKLVKTRGYHHFSLPTDNDEIKKWALLQLPEISAEIFTEEEARKRWPHSFLTIIRYWNGKHPNDKISVFKYPELIQQVLESYDGSYYNDILPHYIMVFKTDDPKEREIQDKLFDHFEKFVQYEKLWKWLLYNRLPLLEKHIDLIFHSRALVYSNFLYVLNKLYFTSIPKRLRELALEALNNPETETYLAKRALQILQFENDFLEILEKDVDRFYPKGETIIDIFQDNISEIIGLRHEVIECLLRYTRAAEVIEPMLRFCFRDYFQTAIPLVTKIMYNLPENKLMEPLKILQDRSVTVRKRALFFATTMGTAKTKCEALEFAGENEKNKSLQKFIFNRTFKTFTNVQDQCSFDLLMKHFKFVFEGDSETRDMVFSFRSIPKVFLGAYIDKVWQEIGKKWVNQHQPVLIAITANVMPYITDELCDDIIQFNLSNSSDNLYSNDVDFIYRYLLSGGDKLDYRFDIVVKNTCILADEHAKLDFVKLNKKSHNIAFIYNELIRNLFSDTERLPAERLLLVNKLIAAFPSLTLPYNHFEYELTTHICKRYLENEKSLPDLIIQLQKDAITKYSELMVHYFNAFIAEQLTRIEQLSKNNEYLLNFAQQLLEKENSIYVKLLAIRLLPTSYPSHETRASQFRKLIEKIQMDATPIVTLYLNNFLEKLH